MSVGFDITISSEIWSLIWLCALCMCKEKQHILFFDYIISVMYQNQLLLIYGSKNKFLGILQIV